MMNWLTIVRFVVVVAALGGRVMAGASTDVTVESNGLRMSVEVSVISTGESKNVVLQGNVVLENVSQSELVVITGPVLGPRIGSHHVWYGAAAGKTRDGKRLKPSPGSLDRVKLGAGESTSLRAFRIESRYGDSIDLFYNVHEELKRFYSEIWTGSLELKIQSR